MTTFDYNYQNSFRFCFVIEICQSRWGLKNNSPNLHKKTTNWRILVVVVKCRHRENGLLSLTFLDFLWLWSFCTNREAILFVNSHPRKTSKEPFLIIIKCEANLLSVPYPSKLAEKVITTNTNGIPANHGERNKEKLMNLQKEWCSS